MSARQAEGAEAECAVCFGATANAVAPCGHAACERCIDAWVARGHATCPTCRGLIVSARRPPCAASGSVRVTFERPQQHAGVTFCAAPSGVRVLRLHPRDRAAACGLVVGDVVTHINDLPVRDHARAAAMADRARAVQHDLVCRLRARRWRWR